MSFHLQKEEDIGAGMHRILLEQIAKLPKDLRRNNRGEAVHEARKRCKRVRAVLRLLRPVATALYHRENRIFRDLARSLSSLRDSDARAETFRNLVQREKGGAQHFSALRPRPEFKPTRRRARLPTLVRTAKAAQKRLGRLRLPGGRGLQSIEQGFLQSYQRGRAAMRTAYDRGGEIAFHEWRKRVKDLDYQIQILRELWLPVLQRVRKELEKLGDLLGQEHDLMLLRKTLPARARARKSADLLHAFLGLLDRRTFELQAEAQAIGRRVYAEKPKNFMKRIRKYWETWQAEISALSEAGGPALRPAHARAVPIKLMKDREE